MPQTGKTSRHHVLSRAFAFITAMAFSVPGVALERIVPDDHKSIADAITAVAGTVDATVIVKPGAYQEVISIPDNVVLRGQETARTFLTGTGPGPIISASGTGSRISNFTFTGTEGSSAILINGGSNLIISNNVFAMGSEGTAIRVETASPSIEHNVFFENGTALNTGGSVLTIQNNVFADNVLIFTPEPVDVSRVSHNGFFDENKTVTTFGANPVSGDHRFVDPGQLDFHLMADSPYIDAGTGTDDALDGTQSDIGAYGGEHAEGIPFPIGTPTIVRTTDTSITLRWPANAWYRVGGYRLYYDSDRSGSPYTGADADNGSSPIDVGKVTEYTLQGLTLPTPPLAPVLSQPETLNGALKLSWSAVPGASGYVVHYGIASTDEHSIDVGNVTRYTLSGLQNGTTYRITVSSYAAARYFLSVAAFASFGDKPESALSQEVSTTIGDPISGAPSNEISDFPEAIVPFPNLPDQNGCFIATAAYGHYSADEVQLLRAFRDRHLLTNAPGRIFVAWYYRNSPEWAQALNENSWAKPAVRLALRPLIGIAGFTLNTPAPIQWGVSLGLLSLLLLMRNHLRHRLP